jgi:hypothetical protein
MPLTRYRDKKGHVAVPLGDKRDNLCVGAEQVLHEARVHARTI